MSQSTFLVLLYICQRATIEAYIGCLKWKVVRLTGPAACVATALYLHDYRNPSQLT